MLHDILSSFPLKKVLKVERAYAGQVRVLLMQCRHLNTLIMDRGGLQQATGAVESLIEVLDYITTSATPKRKAEAPQRFSECVKEINRITQLLSKNVNGSEPTEIVQLKQAMDKAKSNDGTMAQRSKSFREELDAKLDSLKKVPKIHVEFWVWEPYLPPLGQDPVQDQQHIQARRQLTFEKGTLLATALIYFMVDIKEHRPWDWSASLADNVHFYEKFPVDRRDFTAAGGRGVCIAALDLSLPVEKLVDKFSKSQSPKLGRSTSHPLPVQVLTDRKSCIFFESPNFRRTVGNVFKISDLIVFRDKCGELFTKEFIDATLPAVDNPKIWRFQTSVWAPQSSITSWVDLFERFFETGSGADDGEHWWYTSQLPPWLDNRSKLVPQVGGAKLQMPKPIFFPGPVRDIREAPGASAPQPVSTTPTPTRDDNTERNLSPNTIPQSRMPGVPKQAPPPPQQISESPRSEPQAPQFSSKTAATNLPNIQARRQDTGMMRLRPLGDRPDVSSAPLHKHEHVYRPTIPPPSPTPSKPSPPPKEKSGLFSGFGFVKKFWRS